MNYCRDICMILWGVMLVLPYCVEKNGFKSTNVNAIILLGIFQGLIWALTILLALCLLIRSAFFS